MYVHGYKSDSLVSLLSKCLHHSVALLGRENSLLECDVLFQSNEYLIFWIS